MHFLKKGQKIRARVDTPPLIWAMPERKRFFFIEVFPNHSVYTITVFLQENISQDTSFCETTPEIIIDYGYISQAFHKHQLRTQRSVSFLYQQSVSQCGAYHNRIVTKVFKHFLPI